MAHEPSDEALLTGDGDAFALLYARTEDAVLAYFLRRTRDAELAADLTAETYAQALASRGRFRARRGPARAWLFGIAGHVLSRSLRAGRVERRARTRLGLAPLSLTDDALERVEVLAGADVVALALTGLPAAQREAVRARVVDEEPYAAIAARLSCSEAVVRQRVTRGLRSLRTTLEEHR